MKKTIKRFCAMVIITSCVFSNNVYGEEIAGGITDTNVEMTPDEYLNLVEIASKSNKIEDFKKLNIYSIYTNKPILENATQKEFDEFKSAVNRIYSINLNETVTENYIKSQEVADLAYITAVLGGYKKENIVIKWSNVQNIAHGSTNIHKGDNIQYVNISRDLIGKSKRNFLESYAYLFEDFVSDFTGYVRIGESHIQTIDKLIGFQNFITGFSKVNNVNEYDRSAITNHLKYANIAIFTKDINNEAVDKVLNNTGVYKSPANRLLEDNVILGIQNTMKKAVAELDFNTMLVFLDKNMVSFKYKGHQENIMDHLSNDIWGIDDYRDPKVLETYAKKTLVEEGELIINEEGINYFLEGYNDRIIGNKMLIMASLNQDAYNEFEPYLKSLLEKGVDIKCEKGPFGDIKLKRTSKYYSAQAWEDVRWDWEVAEGTLGDFLECFYYEYAEPFGYSYAEYINKLIKDGILKNDYKAASNFELIELTAIFIPILEKGGLVLSDTPKDYMLEDIPLSLSKKEKSIWVKQLTTGIMYGEDPYAGLDYRDTVSIVMDLLQYEKEINNYFAKK